MVTNKEHLAIIIEIFNQYMILEKTLNRFNNWVLNYKLYYKVEEINIKTEIINITKNSA
jgi:hypothetical protein